MDSAVSLLYWNQEKKNPLWPSYEKAFSVLLANALAKFSQ